jgi:hypothetical protein
MARAQAASAEQEAAAKAQLEAAFEMSARTEPLGTFGPDSDHPSALLESVRSAVPPAEAAVLEASLLALQPELAPLLILEHQARKSYKDAVLPFWRRLGAALALLPSESRAAFLTAKAAAVGDPSVRGSMFGLPLPGRDGGVPAVFSTDASGAMLLEDEEEVVLLSDTD